MKNIDKKKIYEFFGAVWFQKVVFVAEDIKYKVIDKFFPNIYEWYSKRCDIKVTKLCKKTNCEEKKNNIRREFNYKKMALKKELIERKNRNYHITLNNANSFYNYLLWNKKVHLKGLIRNIISIAGCSIAINFLSGTWLSLVLIYLIFNTIALAINFECINLQNYNICRFNKKKELLTKLENRQKEKDKKNYALMGKTIYEQLEENIERPKSEKIISKLNTSEELEQLRKLALEIKKCRYDSDKENDIKSKKRVKK